ncbi:beta-1,6-N-acetylglucosaminyltransferase [Flavobacterium quisquiliarum]|uniref:Peptide O-xylosyltransferase n=1 Tax=Flavobacterium quisquiliarum TaxID=1834436 RepID=A0ABV8WBA2_9FLAO|nr:beta-1,6-N-acetylglucosaminyltransferase [Flavobacterium quisquiliarum]MBW1657719.1 hypothetical protein [Flavobacterium quisquiliarum]
MNIEINYIILAHRYPKQIRRLIEKLATPESCFYIHIDKNVPIDPFLNELSDLSNVSFVTERREGIWGDLGIVIATLNALKQIVQDEKSGYCVLMSGQDYPIKSNNDIQRYLKSNSGNDFIDVFPLPAKYWSTDRIIKYKFNLSSRKGHFILIGSVLDSDFFSKKNFRKIYTLIKAGRFDFRFKIFNKRRYPNYIKPYGGSQWWALTLDTVKKIIAFVDEHPDFVEYHTYSLLPDEMFYQSIVMHLIEKEKGITIMPLVTYINWEKKECDLPVTFTSLDFDELISQPESKLFARKFDSTIDEDILTKIDAIHSHI